MVHASGQMHAKHKLVNCVYQSGSPLIPDACLHFDVHEPALTLRKAVTPEQRPLCARGQVTRAVDIARKMRPDLPLDGPMQYDAAVDPVVAQQKVKGQSAVAGRATVCIFPDLNTGNNTYKVCPGRSALADSSRPF